MNLSMTQFAFLGFISLFIVLIFQIILFRSVLTLSKKKEINGFSPQGDDYTSYYQRLTRVHANLYENTPLWLGILGYALMMDKTALTDGLSLWFLLARIGQVLIHLLSTQPWANLCTVYLF